MWNNGKCRRLIKSAWVVDGQDKSRPGTGDDPGDDPWCHVHRARTHTHRVTLAVSYYAQFKMTSTLQAKAPYWRDVIYITQSWFLFYDTASCVCVTCFRLVGVISRGFKILMQLHVKTYSNKLLTMVELCWGRHFGLRGWKEQQTGENCLDRSFWSRWNGSKTRLPRRWPSTEQKKGIKVLAGKDEVNRPYERSRRGWKDSKKGLRGTGLGWLRKRASGGLCEHGNES